MEDTWVHKYDSFVILLLFLVLLNEVVIVCLLRSQLQADHLDLLTVIASLCVYIRIRLRLVDRFLLRNLCFRPIIRGF